MSDRSSNSIAGRLQALSRLQIGLVFTIGLSCGLIATFGNASPVEIAATTGIGLVLGGLLTWYITAIAPDSGTYGRTR